MGFPMNIQNPFKTLPFQNRMLKADFHLHAREDKQDRISYSAKDLIRLAAKQKFDVLSFTFHDDLFYPRDLISFAKKRGITLVPGTELTIHGRHVLVNGIKKLPKVKELTGLEKLKDEAIITAPHPFFPTSTALREQLLQNLHLFNNIEYTARYNQFVNFNKKAASLAQQSNKPLLGNSDCHHLIYFGYTFTQVDASPSIDSILEALRKKKFQLTTTPLPTKWLLKAGIENAFNEYVVKRISPQK